MSSPKSSIGRFIFPGIITVVVISTMLIKSNNNNESSSKKVLTAEEAQKKMDKIYSEISVTTVPPRADLTILEALDLRDALPDISKFPPQVDKQTDDFVEIFSSTEKTGSDKDGWLKDIAIEFNNSQPQIDGTPVSVCIRGIASGTATDYILSGRYRPDAFTPSNELWGEMIKSHDIKIDLIEKKLAGNVAGILTSSSVNTALTNKYGAVTIKSITNAVSYGEIKMGYTNPFASSTGINFLVTALSSFDNKDLLSTDAIDGFQKFQANIPYVAFTTLQMRESAKTGSLDGFIMEYQTYFNSKDLKSNYIFSPFGYRHDSPMYSIGTLTPLKEKILKQFVAYCKSESSQNIATSYGFNYLDDYKPEMTLPSGNVISNAQKLWKEKKDANKEIIAVFVADISGSMSGEPLLNLKKSLITGSQYISKDNSVGLVSFSNEVKIHVPIAKFDDHQRSVFTNSVNDLETEGNTAMYDAILVGTKMLLDAKKDHPKAKLMLFTLTDGETNAGHTLKQVEPLLRAYKIPVYTIGYNADISALQSISNINEAASINADSDDVIYKLGCLFNAQM